MGRPKKEPTKTIRVPVSRVAEVKAMLSRPPTAEWVLNEDESKTLLSILGTQSDTKRS